LPQFEIFLDSSTEDITNLTTVLRGLLEGIGRSSDHSEPRLSNSEMISSGCVDVKDIVEI
jgi:hypothetical protein